MIVHLPTGKTFITQKDAKLYFGNHHYRRLVKKVTMFASDFIIGRSTGAVCPLAAELPPR